MAERFLELVPDDGMMSLTIGMLLAIAPTIGSMFLRMVDQRRRKV